MFNFGFDKRMLYIIFGVLIISGIARFSEAELLAMLLTLPGVIIAITFHEFAHAYSAYKLGDDTPRIQGRVTLNPGKHIDPFGFIMLILAHIGWGKPVEINPRNFNTNISMSKGEMIVSLAGPLMNFVLATIFTLIYFLLGNFAKLSFLYSTVGDNIMNMILYTVFVNIGLGVFNLLPVPPLDGSKIFRNILPYKAKSWFDRNEQIFHIIFLIIWITGLASIIISPIINGIANGLFWIFNWIFSFFI